MNRRRFVKTTGGVAAAAALAGCAPQGQGEATNSSTQRYEWKMVTSWPRNFPGLGTGANLLAEIITRMSGGRLTVKVFGANDLVPPFEVFDAVSRGTAEMGHSAAYYWKGKSEAAQFFASVPFGLNAMEMNAWLYFGGGLDLWRELYADFDLVPFPGGNSGVQMGGWFNREIHSVDDLEGLKMRIPGIGGEVLRRAGGTPVNLPGAEVFTALQSGAIDATEWVGPFNDLAFGLFQVAQYYYYPGWHEPGTTLEVMVNKSAYEALPNDLQAIVEYASRAVNDTMLAEFTARNGQALNTLTREHGVDLRAFPPDVLARLASLSDEVVAEAATDDIGRRIFASYTEFRDATRAWHAVSEEAYFAARRG